MRGPAPAVSAPGSTSKLLAGVFVVVALLVGLGVGFAGAQSKVTKTQKELAATTNDRDAYHAQVDDRADQITSSTTTTSLAPASSP
jgi:uncharacterized protein HemX